MDKKTIMRFNIYGNLINPDPDGMYVRHEDHAREIAALKSELEATKRAALTGMDAAKRVSTIQLQEAQRARAESSPEVLASERAANAILTDENERLRAARPFCVDCGDSIEAHNPGTCGTCHETKYSSAPEPQWIVNDQGELGVRVGARFFFLYKGDNLESATLVYRPGLSFGKPEDGDWKPLPAAPSQDTKGA